MHPLGDQATFILGRAGHSRYRLTDKGPLPPVFVEINPRVSSVFKEFDFGECMRREIHPKALTFPVDTLGTTSRRRES